MEKKHKRATIPRIKEERGEDSDVVLAETLRELSGYGVKAQVLHICFVDRGHTDNIHEFMNIKLIRLATE